jgi:hypothetical protein
VAEKSDIAWANTVWNGVPWAMQNFIFFYLRTHHFPVTPWNTALVAQAISKRLTAGPIKHYELEVVIEQSAVEYRLDVDRGDA